MNVSSDYEIQEAYAELKTIRRTIARLRRQQDDYRNAGHLQDAHKNIDPIQRNYENSIEIIKEILEKLHQQGEKF